MKSIEIKMYLLIQKIRETLFFSFDPTIRMKIGKKKLFINLSHKLPMYYYRYKNYDKALPRICQELKNIDNYLGVVDIGANIGDTVSLINDEVNGKFLCIEGDDKFFPILEKNVKLIKEPSLVKIEKCYCGDKVDDFSVIRENGTAKIVKNKLSNNDLLSVKTLDDIIDKNMSFGPFNVLKTDTDGFEIDVLNGGKNFLKEHKPLIYFEFTPQLYAANNQNYKDIFNLLKECGYKESLFYDNFGEVIKKINIDDYNEIEDMVNRIDEKNIYYYDILIYNKDKSEYSKILESELNLFKNNDKQN